MGGVASIQCSDGFPLAAAGVLSHLGPSYKRLACSHGYQGGSSNNGI